MDSRGCVALLATLLIIVVATGSVGGIVLESVTSHPGWSGDGFTITANHTIAVGDGQSAHVKATLKTQDGGLLLVGGERRGGNLPGPHRAAVWKVSQNGALEWTRFLGGNETVATAIAPTESGYVIAGATGYETTGPDMVSDVSVHVWHINSTGRVQADYAVETSGFRYPTTITSFDDGVVLAGVSQAALSDGDVTEGVGWIAYTTDAGSPSWERSLSGEFGGTFQDVMVHNSQITVVGTFSGNQTQPWLLTLAADGSIRRNQTIGNSTGMAQVALSTGDGATLVAGTVIRNWTGDQAAERRLAVWHVTDSGTVLWSRTLANSSGAKATDLLHRSSGRYVLSGEANLPGADTAILEFTGNGTVTGVAVFGGEWPEYPVGVHESQNGSLLIAGYQERSDFSHIEDLWLANLTLTGEGTGSVGTIADPTTTMSTTTQTTNSTTSGDTGAGFGVLLTGAAVLIVSVFVRGGYYSDES